MWLETRISIALTPTFKVTQLGYLDGINFILDLNYIAFLSILINMISTNLYECLRYDQRAKLH